MKRNSIPKIWGLLLSITLSLSGPVYALRQTNGPESTGLEENLKSALESKKTDAGIYVGTQVKFRPLVREIVSSLKKYPNPTLEQIYEAFFVVSARHDPEFTAVHMEQTKRYVPLLVESFQRRGLYTNPIYAEALAVGVGLHDVGKIFIPRKILHKPGKLTEAEWEAIKGHPILGADLVKAVRKELQLSKDVDDQMDIVMDAIQYHHVWWNDVEKKSYPAAGLKGNQIPFPARVASVVDAYDAMIDENRPYQKAKSVEEARRELQRSSRPDQRSRGIQFDPWVVRAFLGLELEAGERSPVEGKELLSMAQLGRAETSLESAAGLEEKPVQMKQTSEIPRAIGDLVRLLIGEQPETGPKLENVRIVLAYRTLEAVVLSKTLDVEGNRYSDTRWTNEVLDLLSDKGVSLLQKGPQEVWTLKGTRVPSDPLRPVVSIEIQPTKSPWENNLPAPANALLQASRGPLVERVSATLQISPADADVLLVEGFIIAPMAGIANRRIHAFRIETGQTPPADYSSFENIHVYVEEGIVPDQIQADIIGQGGKILVWSTDPEAEKGVIASYSKPGNQEPLALLLVRPETANRVRQDLERRAPIVVMAAEGRQLNGMDPGQVRSYLLQAIDRAHPQLRIATYFQLIDKIPGRNSGEAIFFAEQFNKSPLQGAAGLEERQWKADETQWLPRVIENLAGEMIAEQSEIPLGQWVLELVHNLPNGQKTIALLNLGEYGVERWKGEIRPLLSQVGLDVGESPSRPWSVIGVVDLDGPEARPVVRISMKADRGLTETWPVQELQIGVETISKRKLDQLAKERELLPQMVRDLRMDPEKARSLLFEENPDLRFVVTEVRGIPGQILHAFWAKAAEASSASYSSLTNLPVYVEQGAVPEEVRADLDRLSENGKVLPWDNKDSDAKKTFITKYSGLVDKIPHALLIVTPDTADEIAKVLPEKAPVVIVAMREDQLKAANPSQVRSYLVQVLDQAQKRLEQLGLMTYFRLEAALTFRREALFIATQV